ncbi:MAG: hypothetical protein K6T83_17640 [Alicyclobacillus sp.]|nr:hypothetical protein [Alicyclobacillus sp.]
MKRFAYRIATLGLAPLLSLGFGMPFSAYAAVLSTTPSAAPQEHVRHVHRAWTLDKPELPPPPKPRMHPPVIYGMRKFPYPYRAMLAISSDADHETLRKFNLIHEFINTTQMTPMGRGLGLDFADSFFMYNGSNLPKPIDYGNVSIRHMLTYFQAVSNKPYAANLLNWYIHAGWIDTLHSYGDFSRVNSRGTLFSRRLAVQAIAALKRAHDQITVWTDHGNQSNVDNFGSYGTDPFYDYQQGANPHSPYYHTDMTIPYGIHFVWTDHQSPVFGHDSMLYPLRLPDGRWVWGFYRYTSILGGRPALLHYEWTSDALAVELCWANLKSIIVHEQYAIVAQHLEADNTKLPLAKNAIDALRRLAKQYRLGNILVARTSRLLQYNVTQQYLRWHVTHNGDITVIHLDMVADPIFGYHRPALPEIRGITFYTANPANTQIDIGDQPLNPVLIRRYPSDGLHPSIGVAWYPADTRNYARTEKGVW